MTLNLSEPEMKLLNEMAAKKDISKTAVIRQALRIYQVVEKRREAGEALMFENESTRMKAELLIL